MSERTTQSPMESRMPNGRLSDRLSSRLSSNRDGAGPDPSALLCSPTSASPLVSFEVETATERVDQLLLCTLSKSRGQVDEPDGDRHAALGNLQLLLPSQHRSEHLRHAHQRLRSAVPTRPSHITAERKHRYKDASCKWFEDAVERDDGQFAESKITPLEPPWQEALIYYWNGLCHNDRNKKIHIYFLGKLDLLQKRLHEMHQEVYLLLSEDKGVHETRSKFGVSADAGVFMEEDAAEELDAAVRKTKEGFLERFLEEIVATYEDIDRLLLKRKDGPYGHGPPRSSRCRGRTKPRAEQGAGAGAGAGLVVPLRYHIFRWY